jgi:hypothetical protein
MAIYLDDQTRGYLERMFKEVDKKDSIGKRIRQALKDDAHRLDKMANCEHVAGEYVGKKTCCTKCESFFEPGMGETWTYVQR